MRPRTQTEIDALSVMSPTLCALLSRSKQAPAEAGNEEGQRKSGAPSPDTGSVRQVRMALVLIGQGALPQTLLPVRLLLAARSPGARVGICVVTQALGGLSRFRHHVCGQRGLGLPAETGMCLTFAWPLSLSFPF